MNALVVSRWHADEDAVFQQPADATSATPMTVLGPPGRFVGTVELARWDGRVIARTAGRVLVVDVSARVAKDLQVDGAFAVQDVATTGRHLAALVRRTERAPLTLLLADRGATPLRWEEHAMPAEKISYDDASTRLAGGEPGVAVFGSEGAYFLSGDRWYAAPTRHLTEQSPSQIVWSEGRWHMEYFGGHCSLSRFSSWLSMGARAEDARLAPPRGACWVGSGYLGPIASDENGQLWSAGWNEGGCIAPVDGSRVPTTMRRTFDGDHAYARAEGRLWDLGSGTAFTALAFDEEGRAVVGSQFHGVFRRDRDETWSWLTPGWPSAEGVVDVLPDHGSLVIVTSDRSLGIVSPSARTFHRVAVPAREPPTPQPGRTSAGIREHPTVARVHPARPFPFVAGHEPTLGALLTTAARFDRQERERELLRQKWTPDYVEDL